MLCALHMHEVDAPLTHGAALIKCFVILHNKDIYNGTKPELDPITIYLAFIMETSLTRHLRCLFDLVVQQVLNPFY